MVTFGSAGDRRELAVCQLLVRFYQILDENSMYLSEEAKTEIATVGRQLCIVYAALASTSAAAHEKMWKMNPKLHLFDHLCEWQAGEVGNPRSFWTYADEDLVGLLVEVAESCHPKTMAVSALFKWLHTYYKD